MSTVKTCVQEATNKFLYFFGIYWQFRLNRFLIRFLISVRETLLSIARKIK